MALPKDSSAAEAVASPSLDLKWSLTLRVVTVALLCFAIAAARMGADYSWVRGVTWLMQNRVLASRAP
jgi:Na+/glutamate symporter